MYNSKTVLRFPCEQGISLWLLASNKVMLSLVDLSLACFCGPRLIVFTCKKETSSDPFFICAQILMQTPKELCLVFLWALVGIARCWYIKPAHLHHFSPTDPTSSSSSHYFTFGQAFDDAHVKLAVDSTIDPVSIQTKLFSSSHAGSSSKDLCTGSNFVQPGLCYSLFIHPSVCRSIYFKSWKGQHNTVSVFPRAKLHQVLGYISQWKVLLLDSIAIKCLWLELGHPEFTEALPK